MSVCEWRTKIEHTSLKRTNLTFQDLLKSHLGSHSKQLWAQKDLFKRESRGVVMSATSVAKGGGSLLINVLESSLTVMDAIMTQEERAEQGHTAYWSRV